MNVRRGKWRCVRLVGLWAACASAKGRSGAHEHEQTMAVHQDVQVPVCGMVSVAYRRDSDMHECEEEIRGFALSSSPNASVLSALLGAFKGSAVIGT